MKIFFSCKRYDPVVKSQGRIYLNSISRIVEWTLLAFLMEGVHIGTIIVYGR